MGKEEDGKNSISRREFISGAAIMGAAAAAGAGLAGCNPAAISGTSNAAAATVATATATTDTSSTDSASTTDSSSTSSTTSSTTSSSTDTSTKTFSASDPTGRGIKAPEASKLKSTGRGTSSYSPDGKGYAYEQDGFRYIHIEGAAYDRGFEYGSLLGSYAADYIAFLKSEASDMLGLDWTFLKSGAKSMWTDSGKITTELLQELQGIVAGATESGAAFDLDDLIVANGWSELVENWFPRMSTAYYSSITGETAYSPLGYSKTDAGITGSTTTSSTSSTSSSTSSTSSSSTSSTRTSSTSSASSTSSTSTKTGSTTSSTSSAGALAYSTSSTTSASTTSSTASGTSDHCTAFIATGSYTTDGSIVAGHSTSALLSEGRFGNVIVDVVPTSGRHFVMQSAPGLVWSSCDYYQSDKLVVTGTVIGGFSSYDATKTPGWVRIRSAAQNAGTHDEFTDTLLDDNNGGHAAIWLVGDVTTKEIMRLELGLKFYSSGRTADGYYAAYNIPLDPRLRSFECTQTGFGDVRTYQGARQVQIPVLLNEYEGKLDVDAAKDVIADHHDPYLDKDDNPCARTVCSHAWLDDCKLLSRDGYPAPYAPRGTIDALVADSSCFSAFSVDARFGSACGIEFNVDDYLSEHPQFEYMRDYLVDLPSRPWTVVEA